MLKYKIHFYLQIALSLVMLIGLIAGGMFGFMFAVGLVGLGQLIHSAVLSFLLKEPSHRILLRKYLIGLGVFSLVLLIILISNVAYILLMLMAAILWFYFLYITYEIASYKPNMEPEDFDAFLKDVQPD